MGTDGTSDAEEEEITSSAEFLWRSFCSGQRDKSCSHHFVLNLASQTSLDRTVFGPVTFPSCSSVVSLIIKRVAFVYNSCGLRHPMKLVPFATRVRIDVKAFPSRPSVPLNCFQITFALDTVLSRVHIIGYVKRAHFIHDSITLTSSEFDQTTLRQSSSAGALRNCEDESRILNDLHRIWSSRERRVLVRSIKVSRVEAVNNTGKWTAVKWIEV
ncbi:hypothetical protein Tsp_07003 [Trichinella spiralis]|uniref:hypothetical protein n=1 Tax=Trichinella spiralis TaxID=6334 RepID=UPI0001EFB45B|nr:hypothetical protein Tsp_07003 [Trichinella spiralis]